MRESLYEVTVEPSGHAEEVVDFALSSGFHFPETQARTVTACEVGVSLQI